MEGTVPADLTSVVRTSSVVGLFEGATAGYQTTIQGVDDDGDGATDEELPNGKDDDGDGLIDEDISQPIIHPLVDEDNQDYWALVR